MQMIQGEKHQATAQELLSQEFLDECDFLAKVRVGRGGHSAKMLGRNVYIPKAKHKNYELL